MRSVLNQLYLTGDETHLFVEVAEEGTTVEIGKSVKEGAPHSLTVGCDTQIILAQHFINSRTS